MPAASVATRPSMTPGTMCRCLPASPALCATALPSRTGICRRQWNGVRRPLKTADDGDRQMVSILTAVLGDGLDVVEAACQQALAENVCSSAVILNILARRRDPAPAVTIITPDALRLQHEPQADCARYDTLRRAS